MRRLIVNADDLGYDPEIDRGILEAHARGIVTCATAMVDTPFAAAALRDAPATLGIGLHAVLDPARPAAEAARDLGRQLERFRELRGAAPSHLDSHRHVHALPALLPIFVEAAARAGLPLRALDAGMRRAARSRGVTTADAFLGDAALRPCWTAERLLQALAALPDGTCELMAHPGYAPRHARTSFGPEREVELRALCDPRVQEALARSGAVLASWDAPPGHGAPAA
jgi:predicted glycoside hydrolase/deacetylase ChbG (UPF0249 family)